jgi:hypothetical protein
MVVGTGLAAFFSGRACTPAVVFDIREKRVQAIAKDALPVCFSLLCAFLRK